MLVDARNRAVGTGEKLDVHRRGVRHRAFSVFLVDERGRLLLQRRQLSKYHSGGLWANACCGHPAPGERTQAAAKRRLDEELNIATTLRLGFHTSYVANVGGGLVENEFVYVFFGRVLDEPVPNPDEVAELQTTNLENLVDGVGRAPAAYAPWLRHYLARHAQEIDRLSQLALG